MTIFLAISVGFSITVGLCLLIAGIYVGVDPRPRNATIPVKQILVTVAFFVTWVGITVLLRW